ncbi:MAG TPA: cytochrome c, partial [Candidatus Limnocylindria bacterium]|nr:cytochrome c [Candidatus Limnocylindria bacterium]
AGLVAWALAAAILVAVWALARSRLSRTARRAAGAALAALFVVVVAGAGSRDLIALANAPPPEAVAAAAQLEGAAAARGEPLYLANCASCHGRDGDGNGPMRTLPAAGPMAEAVARLSPQELEYRIANGMAGTPMPPFVGTLSEPERWDLVAYLRQRFAE